MGRGATFLANLDHDDPNETLPNLLLKLHAQRLHRGLRSNLSTTLVLLFKGLIEDSVIYQLHSLELHVALVQIATDSDTYSQGDGFVVSTSHTPGCFKRDITSIQEYFLGIIECLLFATHYILRYVGTQHVRPSRAAFFINQCRRVWNTLWTNRCTILARYNAIRPTSFRRILADAILHYVVLSIHVL